MSDCVRQGCMRTAMKDSNFCGVHKPINEITDNDIVKVTISNNPCIEGPFYEIDHPKTMAEKYPKYYKSVGNLTEVDTYAIGKLFPVDDPTGCIMHARKKLLVPGTRTGGKTFRQDIVEARDTLNRWLELNPE